MLDFLVYYILFLENLEGLMKKWLRSAVQFSCIVFVPGFLLAQTARIQLIHNSADSAARTVDIYVGTELFQNDLVFRQATVFKDVAPGTVVLGVAPGNSIGSQNAVATFSLQLNAGTSYVGILNGVINPQAFASNPDTSNIALTLLLQEQAREQATNQVNLEFFMVHGVTDAPAIQVGVQGSVNNLGQLKYGTKSAYFALVPTIQTFTLTTVEGSGTDDGADTGQDDGVDDSADGVDDGTDDGVDDSADGVDDGTDDGVDDSADGVDDGTDDGVDDSADGVDDGTDDGVDDSADGVDGGTDDGVDDSADGVDGGTDDGVDDSADGVDGGTDDGVDDSADGVDDGSDTGADDSADGVDGGADDGGGTILLKGIDQQAVFQFTADLTSLAGSSAVLIASGFLNPAANQNGPGLDVLAVLANGQVISLSAPTGVKGRQGSKFIPDVFTLEQNFPNPFNPSTTIAFSLPSSGHVSLEVYDTSGRVVRQIVNDRLSAGRYEVSFDADNLGSGIYFYRLRFGNEVHTRRMLFLK
jgi:hypothetical protein